MPLGRKSKSFVLGKNMTALSKEIKELRMDVRTVSEHWQVRKQKLPGVAWLLSPFKIRARSVHKRDDMAHCNIYANIIWQTKEAKENRCVQNNTKESVIMRTRDEGSRFVYPERKLSTIWTSQFLKDVSVRPNAVCSTVQYFVVFVELKLCHLFTKHPTPR